MEKFDDSGRVEYTGRYLFLASITNSYAGELYANRRQSSRRESSVKSRYEEVRRTWGCVFGGMANLGSAGSPVHVIPRGTK